MLNNTFASIRLLSKVHPPHTPHPSHPHPHPVHCTICHMFFLKNICHMFKVEYMAVCSDRVVLSFESFMIMCTRSNKMLTLHVILYIPVRIDSCLNKHLSVWLQAGAGQSVSTPVPEGSSEGQLWCPTLVMTRQESNHYLPNRFKKFVVHNVSDLDLLI